MPNPAPVAVPAAPVDLEAIITKSVEAATADPDPGDVDDAGSHPDAAAVPDPAQPAETVVPDPPKPAGDAAKPGDQPADKAEKPAEVDEFAKEHGLEPKTKDGRENRIPYSRVTKITANAVTKATKALEDTHTKALAETTAKLKPLEERLAKVGQVEQIMFTDQKRFLDILKTIPGYSELLTPAAPAQVVNDDPEPEPDVVTKDGSRGYSKEGLAKLRAYDRNQALKAANAEVEKRLGPIEKERKDAADRAAADAAVRAANDANAPKIRAKMDRAIMWPLFNEHSADILKLVNEGYDLGEAYAEVVNPKLKAAHDAELAKLTSERAKLREEIIAELKGAPRDTAAGGAPRRGGPVALPANAPVEDVIAASLAAAGLK